MYLTAAEKNPNVTCFFEHKLVGCNFKTGEVEFITYVLQLFDIFITPVYRRDRESIGCFISDIENDFIRLQPEIDGLIILSCICIICRLICFNSSYELITIFFHFNISFELQVKAQVSFSDYPLSFLSVCKLFPFQRGFNIVQMKDKTLVRGEIKTNTV